MKNLSKKQIVIFSITVAFLLILIYLLVMPLGILSGNYYIYVLSENKVYKYYDNTASTREWIDTPFTVLGNPNIPQIVVFCFFAIAFIVFLTLLIVEIKKSKISFTLRPTKTGRMQAQINELQKQVDELKKGE